MENEEGSEVLQTMQLVCSPAGGYRWGLLFQDASNATLLLYEWILNTALLGPSALAAVICALRRPHRRVFPSGYTVTETCFPLVTALCVLYGLANAPIVCIRLLSIVASATTITDLPDREVS